MSVPGCGGTAITSYKWTTLIKTHSGEFRDASRDGVSSAGDGRTQPLRRRPAEGLRTTGLERLLAEDGDAVAAGLGGAGGHHHLHPVGAGAPGGHAHDRHVVHLDVGVDLVAGVV